MSYYFKYNFVSPEPVYATVKEELKSYFDTGAVDDLLFPTFLDKALKKLGRTTYVISSEILTIEDFQSRLPDNFYAVREAWLCTEFPLLPYQSANSFYSQAVTATTIQVSPLTTDCVPEPSPCCGNVGCDGSCMPELIQTVYKTNGEIARKFKREYLLKPGNISVQKHCDLSYTGTWHSVNTPGSSAIDSFDIRDNKFVTNFRQGYVQLLFYAEEYDEIGNQLIPDNYRIKEYIEAYIKFKVFEMLTNQTNDETFNQLQQKLMYHKQLYEEAFIMASIEVKKQDVYTKQRRIINDLHRHDMYLLPNRNNSSRRRRNN